MRKQILFIIGLFFSMQSFAQTGIGTTTPNASAKLDVYSTNKGFLPPRVTLTSATDASTIASPAEGLMVYNVGSVGLQAGYYYWNGSNWATIATATSAGNGVTSMDMVKLYGKAYSAATADSTIANASGYKFLVPVSGRYLFDFSSTGYGNAYFTFKVRQGNTVLAVDSQYSYNNTVHVEYNGKVELNLQAGNTYNVYVFSSGSRDGGDFDRVYYKLVAGNLPVTGQSVDYIQASLSTNQALSAAGNIIFNTSSGTGISITSGGFNLIANKTYKLEAAIGGTSGGYAYYAWVDNSNNLLPGGSIGAVMKAGTAYTDAPQDKAVVYFTPIVDTRVFLRVYSLSGTLTAYAPSTSSNYSSSWVNISQIGSSAFVNPWTLSGTNTFNTSGNVGIGTNNPTSLLNITGGGVKLASGFGNSTNRPSLNTSSIGNYEIRGVGSISGSAQNDLADDGFLRLSAGGGTSVSSQSSIDLSGFSTVADMSNNIVMRTNGTERVRIDNSGNVNVTGKINVTDPSGNVVTKASGIINTGSFVQLDNVKVGPTRNGAGGSLAGLSIGAVSTTFVADISAMYSNNSIGGSTATGVSYSTTAANSAFGWGFSQGNQSTYILNDTTNNRVYRIILMIGASFNNNFISIERLY
jgi:hypothetical protein